MKIIIVSVLFVTLLLTMSTLNITFAKVCNSNGGCGEKMATLKSDTGPSDSGHPLTQKQIDHPKTIHIPGQSKQCTLDGFCGADEKTTQGHTGHKHHNKTVSHIIQPTTILPTRTNSINITGILQSASGWADVFGPNGVNTAGFQVLDLCTPYSVKGGGSLINQTTGASFGSCASFLGMLKTACQASNSDLFKFCTDPRYTNWLVNDYGVYPTGTWNYHDYYGKLINP